MSTRRSARVLAGPCWRPPSLGAPLVLGRRGRTRAEATVTFSVTLPVRATDWTDNVTLPRFDAASASCAPSTSRIEAAPRGHRAASRTSRPAAASLTTRLVRDRHRRPARRRRDDDRHGPARSVTRTDDLAAFDGDHRPRRCLRADRQRRRRRQTTDRHAHRARRPDALHRHRHRSCCRAPGTDTSIPPAPARCRRRAQHLGRRRRDRHLHLRVRHPAARPAHHRRRRRPPSPPTPTPSSPSPPRPAPPPSAGSPRPPAPAPGPRARARGSAHLGAGDDGLSTFSVRATDAAGNVGDGQPPAASPSTGSRPRQPVLTFDAAGPRPERPPDVGLHRSRPGATARCSLDGAAPAAVQLALRRRPDRGRRRPAHLLGVRRRRRRQHRAGRRRHLRARPRWPPRRPPSPPRRRAPATTPPRPGPSSSPRDAVAASCSVDGGPYTSCGTLVHRRPVRRRRRRPHHRGPQRATRPATRARATTGTYRPRSTRARRAHHHQPAVAVERHQPGLDASPPTPARPPSAASTRARGHPAPAPSRRRSGPGATACTCSPSGPPTPPATAGRRRPRPTRSTPPRPARR